MLHPHLHSVVPGGGLTSDGRWVNSRRKFFLPVKVLSRKFRGKFCSISSAPRWPFKTAAHAVEYLGRYTHRVAISHQRILSAQEAKVTFRWRDYRDGTRQKEMTLTADEFIPQVLTAHAAQGVYENPHYGVLSPRNRKTKLSVCRKWTKTKYLPVPILSAVELFFQLTGKDFTVCPH